MSLAAGPAASTAAARNGSLSIVDLLKTSRAGLIASHLWAYLLPVVAGEPSFGWPFWVAFVYATVPLGLLVYGWNDYFDWDVDHLCKRKNDPATSALFGHSLSRAQLARLPMVIVLAQLPFALYWALTGSPHLVGWLLLMAAANCLYNGPFVQLSRVPIVAELVATSVYMLVTWLGVLVHSPGMPGWLWVFGTLSILNLQIMGTVVDSGDDEKVGKRTLSVAFGQQLSIATVLAFLAVKAYLTYRFTGSLAATAVVLVGVALVASGFRVGKWRPSATAYSSFLTLDWIWLAVVA